MSKLTEAREAVGGLSNTTKMPCKSYNLPAQDCKTGAKLFNVPGSVCSGCYALKGNYMWPNVKNALKRRLDAIINSDWVENMSVAINKSEYFRWHDSGDLQSVDHLDRIVQVAKLTPETKHWLPTREAKFVSEYAGDIPDNLIIRVSAAMIDGPPPKRFENTSTVHKDTIPLNSHVCPAPEQGDKCGDCRACWNRDVKNVSYLKH